MRVNCRTQTRRQEGRVFPENGSAAGTHLALRHDRRAFSFPEHALNKRDFSVIYLDRRFSCASRFPPSLALTTRTL
jgi:hypothetical protein